MKKNLRPVVNLKTHLLEGVKFIKSPNFDARPQNTPPRLIVIHGISLPPGQFGGKGVEHFFLNKLNFSEHSFYKKIKGLKVSAHIFIRRGGEINQFVSFNQRAWHAGVSNFQGSDKCNDFSIGIELEGTDYKIYAQEQYIQLAKVITALRQAYPQIKPDNIVGHSDIATGRKTDPGKAFSWEALKKHLNEVIK